MSTPENASFRLRQILGFLSLPLALTLFALYYFRDANPQPPIYDVQMHYDREAWQYFSPGAIVGTLRELNVTQALVTSIANEGTFRLRDEDRGLIAPLLSPYRRREDRATWAHDTTLPGYLAGELSSHAYRGIGELHVAPGQANQPVAREIFALVAERGLVLSLHAEPAVVEEVYAVAPRVRVLWAHAGVPAGPEVVGRLLDRFPNLSAELSTRADIAPRGRLAPAWSALFLRHPDRFMLGSGTYTNELWYQFRYIIGSYRRWLALLPSDVAEGIAHRNAARFFAPGWSAPQAQRISSTLLSRPNHAASSARARTPASRSQAFTTARRKPPGGMAWLSAGRSGSKVTWMLAIPGWLSSRSVMGAGGGS